MSIVGDFGSINTGDYQIGTDGKIYIALPLETYLGVINNPNVQGPACGVQQNAVDLLGRRSYFQLPSFIPSYFLRFNYTGACAGSPFTFTPNFNPVPDSIHWNFGDPASGPNDTTTQLSPVHVFAQGGSYTVSVFVRYPDGRTEQTSRIVTVAGLPAPNLGPDITVCKGTSVTLNPGSFTSYTWNNGTLGQTITIADTGQYWVEVVNDTGCINRDTLQLQWFAQPSLDETDLIIAPTTCNQSTGAITGLQVNALQPYTLTWKNGSGSILGTTPDLYHLPVDNYTLWVSDSAGCITPVKTYTIHNVGDTLILSVNNSAAHCARPDGSIQINATSGLTEMLQYSLNGTDWFSNGGLFSQVVPGSYQVWVKDSLGCKKVYDGNPVVISNIPGPVVQPPAVVPETGGQSNGSISITATSAGDTVWYSINSGTPQPNNGLFSNLSAGSYSLTVADAFGCDTTFTVTLTNLPLIHLEAIAGDGSACLGNVVVVPLLANNFDGVKSFSATLYYDPAIVTCQNTLNTDPLLCDSLNVDLIPALGQVNISWNGNKPISLNNGATLTELSFASVLTGQSYVSWETAPGICRFIDSLGSSIPAALQPGQVKVYSIPKANLNNPKPVCEGDDLLIMPTYQTGTGNGTITWEWTGPNGFTSDKQLVYFPVTTADQSGTYTLTLSDTNHCTSTITAEALIIPTPKPSFAGQDTLYLDPGSDLDAGEGFDTYAWNTGDSTQIIRTGAEGWYVVTLKDGKCLATDSTYITTPYAPLYLPNAFTPDGDRLNDIFRPVTNPEQLTTYSMYIYNRWGGLIFESHNPSIGWDGYCSGGPCPAGAYMYVVKYESKSATLNKKERVLRGMVTVVR
jgi:gliding motility-associated-like protein